MCMRVRRSRFFSALLETYARETKAGAERTIVKKHIATIDEHNEVIGQRCIALANRSDAIKSRAALHWRPKIATPE